MKNKIMAAALIAATSFNMSALDEEFMVVKLKDGTTIEYNVQNVENVAFDVRHTDDAFTVTPADGGAVAAYAAIPTMFRSGKDDATAPTVFGFGTVEAASAEDLIAGEYGVQISLSKSKVYNGELDLASDKDSYAIKLVKYQDGGAEYILEDVVSGTLTTGINSKNQKVTIELNAVFADGTAVTASYLDKPTDVESLEAMIPGINYGNEIYYYNKDGAESHANITSVKRSGPSSGQYTFTINLDSWLAGSNAWTVKLPDTILDMESIECDLPDFNNWSIEIGYAINLTSPTGNASRDQWSNIINNGKIIFVNNGDGTYRLYFEFTNGYSNAGMGTTGGTPERVIFNYVGEL